MINVLDLDYKHLKRTRRVNGERVIEFTVFPTNENKQYFDAIVEEAAVVFKDDEYVIKKLEEKSIGKTYFKQVTAIHKFYVDLINKQQPRIHNGSITFRDYMHMVFEDTPYESFTVEDSFAARQFENLGNDNRLALLQKGLDRFKAEMAILPISYKPIFKIEVGEETDFQFRYGHNIKSISKNIDTTNLATKIAGTGDPELNIKASYTSPNIAIFGIIDAPPVNDERFTSEESLLAEMKARLIDEPEVSITLDFVDLRAAGYPHAEPREGNKVWLIYEPMDDLLIETRILEIVEVYDSNEKVLRTEVTLANHKGSFAGTMFENTQKQLSNLEAEQNRKIQQVIESADGKNSNYYGANEPVPPKGGFKKGDLWFKVVDGEYTQTWRFDGENWVIIVDLDSKEIREEAEKAKQRADDAYDRASSAINDVQGAFDKAQDALGKSNNAFDLAQSGFNKAQSNASIIDGLGLRIENVEGDYTSISGTVRGLQMKVGNIEGDVSTVTQLANGLQTQVSDAEGNISTLQQTSTSLYNRIESAESRMDDIDSSTRNLITHSVGNWEYGDISDSDGQNTSNNRNNSIRTKGFYPIKSNEEYTFSTYFYEDDLIIAFGDIFLYDGDKNFLRSHQHINVDTDNFAAFTTSADTKYYRVVYSAYDELDIDDLGTKIRVKLITGDQITDWSPNLEDTGELLGGVVRYVSEFRQTASTLSNRIASNEGDISSVTQLATGLQTRVVNAEGDISSVTQLANTIQTRVGRIENGTASVITQLKDNINARVIKGDVVNQINIDTSGILISGKKLILDGDTTVNGSFKVRSANIVSLDAGKITTGTFDAAQASIVNLNANSISGGILTSQNHMTFFNLNNGELNIGPYENRVRVNNLGLQTLSSGTVTSELNANGHEFYRGGQAIGTIGTQRWHNDSSYRGLAFSLDNHADYMTWAFKKNFSDTSYTTMLSWHKTSNKDSKGFSFYDNTTFKRDVEFLNGVKFNYDVNFRNLGSIKSYSNNIEWGTGRNNRSIVQFDSGQVQFYMGSTTPKHAFFTNGTKSGGSVEIDNEVLGMSPIDSPQILIEYIEFDIELSKDGTIVYLDEDYLMSVGNYAIFLNNGEVIEKAEDHFIVVGEGLADARVVGKRIEYEEAFWGDMKSLEKPRKEDEPQMRTVSMQSIQDNRIEGFWKRQKTRRVVSEKINGKTMKKVYREG